MRNNMAEPRGGLSLRDLSKAYGEQRAVDGISLEVERGEFVTLLGPSGSGKSTTLGMIAGFVQPDFGSIRLDKEEVTRLPPHRRDIGMVFQNYALFPHMTAAENIAFPLQMRKVDRKQVRQRVGEALALVQLEGLAERYPRQLSGGQQQRVALARAFVFRPRLLLMDEPLGALDKKLREALELEIVRLTRTLGITSVYVTHDQEEALVMSDRIVILNGGRIEQIGTGRDLYEAPTSRFVAGFLGESNMFDGELENSGDRSELWYAGHRIPVESPSPLRRGKATLLVRPEHIKVSPSDLSRTPDDQSVRIPGILRQIIYLGSEVKLLVELGTGLMVSVRTRPRSQDELLVGQGVVINWDPRNAVLVDSEGSGGRAEPRRVAISVAESSQGMAGSR